MFPSRTGWPTTRQDLKGAAIRPEGADSGIPLMPTMPADEGLHTRDIDVSKPNSGPRQPSSLWWLVLFVSILLLVVLGPEWPAGLTCWVIPGLAVLLGAALVVRFVVHHGLLTWMRLARAPAR